jgi:uncharacterized membrane protein
MLLWVSTAFNIPYLRQVVGFLYLTFAPGIVIIHLFRKSKLDIGETMIFSAGISIAFNMVIGLIINIIGPLFGNTNPQSWFTYLTITSLILPTLLLKREKGNSHSQSWSNLNLKLVFLSALCIVMSVVGVLLVNIEGSNNYLLLFMLVFISILIFFTVQTDEPSQTDYIVILAVAASILLQMTLYSNLIHGTGDIYGEYRVFQETLNGYWDPTLANRLNTMLSVTILPTIYSLVLNLEGTWVFKIVFPIIFSLVPVGLFQLNKISFSKSASILGVFFFISNNTFFLEIAVLTRQMIGELFYILLFLTIFNSKIKGSFKLTCFTLFSFGLIVSHYALAYIFLGIILAIFVFDQLFNKYRKKDVVLSMVIIFATMTFAWYIYTTSSITFSDLIINIDYVTSNLIEDFFNPEARGIRVLEATGFIVITEAFWHRIGRYVFYLSELLVLIGFAKTLLQERKLFFRKDYNLAASINMLILIGCIAIPNLAETFNVSRFYHISLFFLAPFCVKGAQFMLKLILGFKKKKASLLITTLFFLLFFMFQTGFTYELSSEDSWSLAISGYRFDKPELEKMSVIFDSEINGAKWLSKYGNSQKPVYSYVNDAKLLLYGSEEFRPIVLPIDSNVISEESYTLLRVWVENSFNFTASYPIINSHDLIFSTGSCLVYNYPLLEE